MDGDTADKTVPAASPAVSATTTQNADNNNNNNSFMVETDYIGAGDAATWAAWVKPYSAPLSEDLTAE